MKIISPIVFPKFVYMTLLFFPLLLIGCEKTNTNENKTTTSTDTQEPAHEKTNQPVIKESDVIDQWQDFSQTLGQYSEAEKDKAFDAIESELSRIDKKINQLEQQWSESKTDVDDAITEKRNNILKSIKQYRNNLQDWAARIQSGSDDAWNELTKGFLNAYDEFTNAFKQSESKDVNK